VRKIVSCFLLLSVCGCASKKPEALAPAAPAERYLSHTIAYQGETLGAIARWYTGSVANWPAIAAANPELNPKKLRVGQIVEIPESLAVKREPFTAEYLAQSAKKSEPVEVAKLEQKETVRDVASLEEALTVTEVSPPTEPPPSLAAEPEVQGLVPAPRGSGDLDEKLFEAVMLEDVALAKEVLKKGANPNYRERNRHLLASAAQNPQSTVLAVLIEGGADVNAIDGIGHTALMRAVAVNSLPNVQTLLQAKADPNIKDNEGNTPLLSTIRDSYVDLARALLDAGADPSAADKDGNSAALLAAESGNLELIKLLGEKKANFNISSAAYTPLLFAMTQEKPELISAVLAAGADPNAKSSSGQYPLHMAIGSPDVVKLLLGAKADPNLVDTYGSSPLARAIRDGDKESAEALIAAGADVNAKGANGSSLLSNARFSSNPEIATLLEAHGAKEE